MAGGLTQLAAYGAQDVYLTGGDPRTYFWNENFTMPGDKIKRTVVKIASAIALAIISFYKTRDIRFALFILIAILVAFYSLHED